MFELENTIDIEKMVLSYNNPTLSKTIKFIDDNTISFVVHDNTYRFFRVSLNSCTVEENELFYMEDYLLDYMYIGDDIYVAMVADFAPFDEHLVIYRLRGEDDITLIASLPRASYQHDMGYMCMFNKNGQFRLMIIRHSRLYLYTVDEDLIDDDMIEGYEKLREIAYIDGNKWLINQGYAVNIKDKKWELYDRDLNLLKEFDFSSYHIDWLGITCSLDKSLIAIAGDSADKETGLLCIYNVKTDEIHIHIQRYGFYSLGIINNHVFTSLTSAYSDVGGMEVFDSEATMECAQIKNKAYNIDKFYGPAPLYYQALGIDELNDNMGLISTTDKLFITDISCKVLQELPFITYEEYALSDNRNTLVMLRYNKEYRTKQMVSLDIYKWSGTKQKKGSKSKADILDIKSIHRD